MSNQTKPLEVGDIWAIPGRDADHDQHYEVLALKGTTVDVVVFNHRVSHNSRDGLYKSIWDQSACDRDKLIKAAPPPPPPPPVPHPRIGMMQTFTYSVTDAEGNTTWPLGEDPVDIRGFGYVFRMLDAEPNGTSVLVGSPTGEVKRWVRVS